MTRGRPGPVVLNLHFISYSFQEVSAESLLFAKFARVYDLVLMSFLWFLLCLPFLPLHSLLMLWQH